MQLPINNQYEIGGIPALQIVEEYGEPIFVYDAAKIVSQYHRLNNAFADCKVQIKYACKALNNINILKLLKNEGSGLDVVSINEARIGLLAGYEPKQILFTPNCVSFDEIQEAVELGIRINIDNISTLEQFGHMYKGTVPCCIRINPHIVAGGNAHIQTGHIDSKFGISIHQMRHITRVVKQAGIFVNGLHMHTGSDILDAGVFLQGAELLFETASNFPDLEFIDFGSGFKVPYKEGDITTDIDALGKGIGAAFKQFCKEYGRELELWFEPGKYLVSESGYLLVKTNVVKQTTATVFVGVNSGQNHLIRPMFYDAYHRIVNVSNPLGTPRIYTVVGYICETDTLGWDRSIAEVREGDILAICNAGAYGYTMSNNYNARFRPAEVLVMDGKTHLIRKAETMDDLMQNVIDIGL